MALKKRGRRQLDLLAEPSGIYSTAHRPPPALTGSVQCLVVESHRGHQDLGDGLGSVHAVNEALARRRELHAQELGELEHLGEQLGAMRRNLASLSTLVSNASGSSL